MKWYEKKKNKDMLFYVAKMLMVTSPFLLKNYAIIGSTIAILLGYYSTTDDDE